MRPTKELQGEVIFKNVSFSYPSRKQVQVLRDISFKIKPGNTTSHTYGTTQHTQPYTQELVWGWLGKQAAGNPPSLICCFDSMKYQKAMVLFYWMAQTFASWTFIGLETR